MRTDCLLFVACFFSQFYPLRRRRENRLPGTYIYIHIYYFSQLYSLFFSQLYPLRRRRDHWLPGVYIVYIYI